MQHEILLKRMMVMNQDESIFGERRLGSIAQLFPMFKSLLSHFCRLLFLWAVILDFPLEINFLAKLSNNFTQFQQFRDLDTPFYCDPTNFWSMTWVFSIFLPHKTLTIANINSWFRNHAFMSTCYLQWWINQWQPPRRRKYMHSLTIPTQSLRLIQGGMWQMNSGTMWTAMTLYVLYFKKFIAKWNMTLLGMLMIHNKWNDKRKWVMENHICQH